MAAVNGSAKVGVDTHKWFNPQIQFNPGMLPQESFIHFSFFLHPSWQHIAEDADDRY